MPYQDHKKAVLSFFNDYVFKYLTTDLEKLASIDADANGIGGCAVPQALSTFAAVDLFGYLVSSDQPKTINMSMRSFLNNPDYFPAAANITQLSAFLDSFRDDVRSVLAHRFFSSQYNIGKLKQDALFINDNGIQIFNVSYFTKLVVGGISAIHQKIANDQFVIAGSSVQDSVKRVYDRLEDLKNHTSVHFPGASAETITTSSSTATQTTESLGR